MAKVTTQRLRQMITRTDQAAIVRSLTDAEPCIEEDGSLLHDLCALAAIAAFLAAAALWLPRLV